MNELELQLQALVMETCAYPNGSLQRQKGMTKIILLIQQSGKLWRHWDPDYADALQQTWIYFCRNLCESTTGNRYDLERASVITWLNAYLKRRLIDLHLEKSLEKKYFFPPHTINGESHDLLENLMAPPPIPPILEEVRAWVQADPTGELRRIVLKHHPAVSCQMLILSRLPPETSWDQISQTFGISISTLSSFYQRQCLPCLRQFGHSQGYLHRDS